MNTTITNSSATLFFKLLTFVTFVGSICIGIVINPFSPIADIMIYLAAIVFYFAIISAAIVFAPDRQSIESDWNKRVMSGAFIDLFILVGIVAVGAVLEVIDPQIFLIMIIAITTLDVVVRSMLLRVREA